MKIFSNTLKYLYPQSENTKNNNNNNNSEYKITTNIKILHNKYTSANNFR